MGRKRRCDGDCLNCGLPDCEVDRTKAEYFTEYFAARYRTRAEAGLCVKCGKEPARPGKRACEACAAKYGAWLAGRRAARMAAGLCTKCGMAPPSGPGKLLCEECAMRQSEYNARYYRRKKKEASDGAGKEM